MYQRTPKKQSSFFLGIDSDQSRNKSSFGFNDIDISSDELDLDDQIANLQRQIDIAEIEIEKSNINLKEKKIRNKFEIDKIQKKICQEQSCVENDYRVLTEKYSREYAKSQDLHEKEIIDFQENLDKCSINASQWMSFKQEISAIQAQTKLMELQTKMEKQNREQKENESYQKFVQTQSSINNKDRLEQYQRRVHAIEEEIAILQDKRRDNNRKTQLKISEISGQMEIRKKEHTLWVQKMKDQFNKQNENYMVHVSSIEQLVEQERMKYKTDNQIMTKKVQNMEKILTSTQERYESQMQTVKKNITNLRRSLQETENYDSDFTDKSQQEMLRMISLQKRTTNNRELCKKLQIEIDRIKQMNTYASRELQKISSGNHTSRNNYAIFSNNLSSRNGYF